MRSVGVRELKEQASQIVRQVREDRMSVDITVRGQVVARLVPIDLPSGETEETTSLWSDIDALAAEIGARWPQDIAAVEAVKVDRREL